MAATTGMTSRRAARSGSLAISVGLGLLLGGALGNLIDRVFRHHHSAVIDFIQAVSWWPVFNVADPSVVGGAILLVTLSAMGYDFDTVGRRRPDDALAVADAPQDTETPDAPAEGAQGDEPQDGTVGSTADQH